MRFQTLASIVPLLATLPAISAYFILSQTLLETTRLDPIVSPGGISSHVHAIAGGSNFGSSVTYPQMQAGQCTTAPVNIDMSNYWIPQLYYYNPSTTEFQAIPAQYMNAYYLPRAGSDGNVTAFPPGLRMISGSPDRRTYNGDADSNAISYVCLDFTTSHQGDPAWAQRNNFFAHNCPTGMRAQVNFRPCWDGVNLDSEDHQSHMAWPSGGVDGGDCPASHPVHLVSLFYEFIFEVQNFPYNNGTDPTWVWANGDTTGYGLHADFISGWPAAPANGTSILQQAINECNANNGVGGELDNCPPFVPYLQSYAGCQPQNDQVDEDIGMGHYIPRLPGNNPLWIGNTTKPSYANYSDANTTFTNFKSVIPAGWNDTGCIAEGTNGRALLGASVTNNQSLTRASCINFCASAGFAMAGMEYGQECYCGNALANGATNTTLLPYTQCGMPCQGNGYENCGGSSTLELFVNPSLFPQPASLPAGWSNVGCYTEGSNSRALTGYSVSGNNMTPDLCRSTCVAKGFVIAGIEYSSQCFCGNSWTAGAVPAASGDCAMTCSGDPNQICGGPNRLTSFYYNATAAAPKSTASPNATVSATAVVNATASANTTTAAITTTSANTTTAAAASATVANAAKNTTTASSTTTSAASAASPVSNYGTDPNANAVTLPSGWTANSCWYDAGGNSRALSAYSTSSSSMTIETCIQTCANKGFTVAGTEYGSECYCDTKLQSGYQMAYGNCSMTCSGNSAQKCGKGNVLSVYSTSAPASYGTDPNAGVVTLASGWASVGCWNDLTNGASVRTLTGASSSGSGMTNEVCMQTCQSKGFVYAGTEYAGECYCGNTLGGNQTQTRFSDCNMACKGASGEMCGAGNRLSLYKFSGSVTTTTAAPAATTTAPSNANVKVAGWAAAGCIAEPPNARALTGAYSAGNMTNEICINYCQANGYSYAGTEYSSQCFCGNALQSGYTNVTASSPTDCSMLCNGNSGEICGGPNRLNLWVNTAASNALPSGWASMGCITDVSSNRTFQGAKTQGNSITVNTCIGFCSTKGYMYAGVEHGGECYCGNSFSGSPTTANSADCNMPCNGDSTVMCGAGNRLNAYYLSASGTALSAMPTSTTAAATATAATAKTTTTSTSTTTTTSTSTGSATSTGSPAANTPPASPKRRHLRARRLA